MKLKAQSNSKRGKKKKIVIKKWISNLINLIYISF